MSTTSVTQVLAGHGVHTAEDSIHVDMVPAELVECALARKEGKLASNGSLVVETGKYTGRSPKDRFVVDTPDVHDKIAWGNVNVPISQESYEKVRAGVAAYLSERDIYVVRGLAGADRGHARKFMVTCELASQALFITQLLVRPTDEERAEYGEPDFTILAAPGYKCDPAEVEGLNSEAAVLVNFAERTVVIAGSKYAGEIKKSVFSVMNYLLPVEDKVLPMHCSASMDPKTHDTAVFFGLSGTGKTTLSADPKRLLIGDDEHGWAMGEGIFNIEGGCYAKCDGLTEEREPEIFRAVKFGALCENVILDDKRQPDYDDVSLTQNTRVGYPVEHIPNSCLEGAGGEPTAVIFLTCDAFGVLPPISRLSADAAMYHFVSGFTSKVAGTELGIKEPVPTFSALFGEPFMPLDPMVYADMLGERIAEGKTRVYLVNTGWVEGSYGVGHRIPLVYNRINVNAALDGTLEEAEFIHDDVFNLDIPTSCPGVPDEVMVPWKCWSSKDEYDATAKKLAAMFQENFEKKYAHLPENVKNAGPRA